MSKVNKATLLKAEFLPNFQKSKLQQAFDLTISYDARHQQNQIDARFNTAIRAEIAVQQGTVAQVDAIISPCFDTKIKINSGFIASVDCVIACNVTPNIIATDYNNTASVDTIVNTKSISNTNALFDINFQLAVFTELHANFETAIEQSYLHRLPFFKPIPKALQRAFSFARSLGLSHGLTCTFEQTQNLSQAIKTQFEQCTGLKSGIEITWQENRQIKIERALAWNITTQKYCDVATRWVELAHQRKQFTYSYDVAQHFEKTYRFGFERGLELKTDTALPWQDGRAIYYRKHNIEPWPTPTTPKYVGSTNLDFQCLCIDPDPHNIILNFGADDCIPQIAPQNGYYIVNTIKVSRLDTGEEIHVINGSASCSRSQWCWNYSLTIPNQEIKKTQSNDGNPVILIVNINGNTHRMLVEDRSLSRQFANTVYTVTGRSPTALLDSPASATRTFLQENERTSVQLIQAEIDRADSEIRPSLNWQLIDDLGWVLPANSLSYSNLTPISAIKQIADAGGGFIYSDPDSSTLSVKPLYKKTYWDSLEIADYDRVISESVTTDISINNQRYPEYNAVYLTNDQTGNTGQVIRTGSAGDILQETKNNPLYTTASVMTSAGKALLAKAGLVETHTFQMPLIEDIGQCIPGEVLAFNGEWWGITDSVSIAFSYDKVMQTVTVERVNQNE